MKQNLIFTTILDVSKTKYITYLKQHIQFQIGTHYAIFIQDIVRSKLPRRVCRKTYSHYDVYFQYVFSRPKRELLI